MNIENGDDIGNWIRISKESKSWKDWKWQVKNAIKSISSIKSIFSEDSYDLLHSVEKQFPLFITPYYLSLIQTYDRFDPIFNMSMPNENELSNPSFLKEDPLEEGKSSVNEVLVHRYKDRALLVSTSRCAMNCRHCTRKRVTGDKEYYITYQQLEASAKYIEAHPDIKDVIISGGDPLLMSDDKLEMIIKRLRSIESLDIIRLGTRTPVTMPMRITDDLVNMIKKYHPIYLNTHFNHPNELTTEATEACNKLSDNGIVVGNQSVLLKGVNDNPELMETLCRKLLKNRVRPYYLFQCDLVKGVEHFRTPIQTGIQIMDHLRGRISGLAIPTFVVDAPEGKGKIPVLPQYVLNYEEHQTLLRNYKNETVYYPEPKK